jgi:hypothetical protein
MGDESILGSQIQFFWENFKLGYEIQLPMPTPPQLLFDWQFAGCNQLKCTPKVFKDETSFEIMSMAWIKSKGEFTLRVENPWTMKFKSD